MCFKNTPHLIMGPKNIAIILISQMCIAVVLKANKNMNFMEKIKKK